MTFIPFYKIFISDSGRSRSLIDRLLFLTWVLVLIFTTFVVPSYAQSSSLQIYTFRTKIPVIMLPATVQYEVIGEEEQWRYIEFKAPTVPVWISATYVEINEGTGIATVLAENLNARLGASVNAKLLNQINSGYKSEILGRSNGFVSVLAPTYFQFSIDSRQLANIDETPQSQQFDLISDSDPKWIMHSKLTEPARPDIAPEPLIERKEEQQAATGPAVLAPQVKQVLTRQNNNQYRLASGDSISVTVFGENDVNLPPTRIPQSGTVSFPLLGPLQVSGKTAQEIEIELIQAFSKGYINNPRLTVNIDDYRPIFIRGAVTVTGSFTFTEGLTIAKALSLAGGTTRAAKAFGVNIEREGQTVYQGLSLNSNQQISSGDIVTVEEEIGVTEEGQLLYVYLHGEVNRPGEYQFRPGLTVEKAVVLAGGFNLRASKRKISVSRYVDNQDVPEVIKKVPLYLPVKPGDIINVGVSWF